MLPQYRPGDLIIGWRWFRPQLDQVVIVRSDRLLLKRIKLLHSNQIWVEGDNPSASTDSRKFGFLPVKSIEAKIVAHLNRKEQDTIN